MTVAPAPDDIVATHAEAERNERVPLLVLEPLARVPRRARARRGADRGRAGRRRPLERDLPRAPRRPRGRRPPPAAPAAAPERARRPARGAAARARSRAPPRASPRSSRCATTRPSSARRSTSWSASRGEVDHERGAGGARHAGGAAAHRRAAHRRARRDPRRRLAGLPRGLRQADGLPRAPAAALRRALGAQPHARASRPSTRVGAWLAEHLPESGPATIVHGDFRLGNAMFAARGARPPRARSSTGRWRRSATRSPTSATCAPRGARPTTRRSAGSSSGASPAPRASRRRAELVARYEERSGREVRDLRLVHDARALEVGRVHGGQLPPRDRGPHRRPVPEVVRRGRDRSSPPAPRRSRSARPERAPCGCGFLPRRHELLAPSSSSLRRFFGSDA